MIDEFLQWGLNDPEKLHNYLVSKQIKDRDNFYEDGYGSMLIEIEINNVAPIPMILSIERKAQTEIEFNRRDEKQCWINSISLTNWQKYMEHKSYCILFQINKILVGASIIDFDDLRQLKNSILNADDAYWKGNNKYYRYNWELGLPQ